MSQDKISIQDETAAIDFGAKDLWSTFTDEQRKQISFYVLNRYASSIKTTDREAQELAVLKTNEYYNKHFFDLAKHPQLLWYLVCMCGNENKKVYFHEWIPFGKKSKAADNKVYKFLESQYPYLSDQELDILVNSVTKADLKDYAKSLGLSDEEIKKLF